jgi:hypothetical protein
MGNIASEWRSHLKNAKDQHLKIATIFYKRRIPQVMSEKRDAYVQKMKLKLMNGTPISTS